MNNTKEKDKVKQAVKDILWMARRYADGRSTYVPSQFNEAQKILVDYFGKDILGLKDDTVKRFPYAIDGMAKGKDFKVNNNHLIENL